MSTKKRFAVAGTDRASGFATRIFVEATSSEDAKRFAEGQGMAVDVVSDAPTGSEASGRPEPMKSQRRTRSNSGKAKAAFVSVGLALIAATGAWMYFGHGGQGKAKEPAVKPLAQREEEDIAAHEKGLLPVERKSEYDEFKDQTNVTLILNLVPTSPHMAAASLVVLCIFEGKTREKFDGDFYLHAMGMAKWSGTDLNERGSVVCLVDGNRIVCDETHGLGGSGRFESFSWGMQTGQLRNVASGKSVRFKVGTVEFAPTSEHLAALGAFVKEMTGK